MMSSEQGVSVAFRRFRSKRDAIDIADVLRFDWLKMRLSPFEYLKNGAFYLELGTCASSACFAGKLQSIPPEQFSRLGTESPMDERYQPFRESLVYAEARNLQFPRVKSSTNA